MKVAIIKNILAVLVLAMPMLAAAGSDSSYKINANTPMNTDDEKFSYILGVDFADNFTKSGVQLNPELVYLGIKAALSGEKHRMTEAEMQAVLDSFHKKMNAQRKAELEKMEAQLKIDAVKNKKASDEFLAANQSKPGVKVTKSGLQYKVNKSGSGASPASNEYVLVEYTGKFIDGKVFDSTTQHGQPASLPLNNVIPGWREALQMMKVGDEWSIVVPYDLAYGESGQGMIGPNQALIFDVKLLDIQKEDNFPSDK